MIDVPPPEVTLLSGTRTVSHCPTDSSVRCNPQIDPSSDTLRGSVIMEDSSRVDVKGQNPGTEYIFSITRSAENGNQSKPASASIFTGEYEKKKKKNY